MRYIARIELHSGLYNPDFETLHRAMEHEGSSRLIESDDGRNYHLPRGEYNILTIKTLSQVLDSAQRAVAQTGRTAEIFIAQSDSLRWSGLAEKK